jgi:hypothetical protein
LVRGVGELKGIVYVHHSPSLPKGLEGALLSNIVSTPDGTRYLTVAVRPNVTGDHLIAVIAHELQHAIEVLASPATTSTEVERLPANRGSTYGEHVAETDAAQVIGRTVEHELKIAANPIASVAGCQ